MCQRYHCCQEENLVQRVENQISKENQKLRQLMVGFRVTEEEKRVLDEMAKKEHRSLANFIRLCVITCLEHHYDTAWPPDEPDE